MTTHPHTTAGSAATIRLGISSRLLGQAWLRANPAPAGHLSIGLLWLRAVLHYLVARQIAVYRLPDRLAACIVAHDRAQLRRDARECGTLLDELRATIADSGTRLTMHLAPELAPGVEGGYETRIRDAMRTRLELLDLLGSPGSVLVTHIGGAGTGALGRYARLTGELAGSGPASIVVENGDCDGGLPAALALHQQTGVPVVLDVLHQQINNPGGMPLAVALERALATWPPGQRPKLHLASQRTEAHLLKAGRDGAQVVAPRIGQHADFLNPFECIALFTGAQGGRGFDALLEAKAGDLALIRLRHDMARFAPALGAYVQGI
jgi:UV DNA damage endonuclease